jgi:hypothetical protein
MSDVLVIATPVDSSSNFTGRQVSGGKPKYATEYQLAVNACKYRTAMVALNGLTGYCSELSLRQIGERFHKVKDGTA